MIEHRKGRVFFKKKNNNQKLELEGTLLNPEVLHALELMSFSVFWSRAM